MKTLFIVLLFIASSLDAAPAIVLSPGESVTITAIPGAVVPPTVPPAIPPSIPPPGTWNGTCPGFTRTLIIPINWANPVNRSYTKDYGGFGPNDAIVLTFTTGNIGSTWLGKIIAAEYDGSPSSRIAVLSPKPCDFGVQPAYGAYNEGNTVTIQYAIEPGSGLGFYPVLQKNTTYYFNLKNNPGATCFIFESCNMFIDFFKAAAGL